MQLRCTYCQTMFALGRDDMLAALEHMEENKLIYHDAHCPKCRKANRVEGARMERSFPDWKTAIKTMAKEASRVEIETGKQVADSTVEESTPIRKPAAKKVKKHSVKKNRSDTKKK